MKKNSAASSSAHAQSAPSGVKRKKILLVDDHPIFRRGLAESIRAAEDLEICGEAENSREALSAVLALKPDLAVLDITLPDKSGLDLLKDILAVSPDTLVMIVSMHEETLYAERALRAGARGYVMKDEDPSKLLQCIRQILAGSIYVSEGASMNILQSLSGNKTREPRSAVEQLSEREFEVFQLIAQGRTTSEIAELLHLSMRTVVVHCSNIRRKLNIKHAPELIRYAVRWIGS
jgi:DNA-binding NarL/FixJ family response regulator